MSISFSQEEAILKEMIINYEVISFDVFDTLVLREVINPTDLFNLFEYKLNFKLDKEPVNKNNLSFKNLRVQSEVEARQANSNKEDITFDDIYKVISEKIGNTKAQEMKQAELDLENEFIVVNPFMKKIYDFALNQNKKIIIITDMYLPKDFLEKKLIELGYHGFDGLYVSGELNKTKAYSTIFPYVQEKHNISKEKWLHIGDNEVSDFINPKNFGISSYHYKKISERARIKNIESVEDSIITAIKINKLYTEPELSYWEKFGIDKLSPLYFGFVNWLVQLTKDKDNLYFLARDGYLPHKIYEMFRKYEPNLPKAKYIYASRRAYQYPQIFKMHKNQAIALLTEFNWGAGQRLYLIDIFNNIGLNPTEYEHIYELFGIKSIYDEIKVDSNLHAVRKFLCHIYPDILKKLKEEYDLLISYLKQEGVNEYEQINIVDIGWRGSTQYAMKEILGKNVVGYYFGTISTMNPDIYSDSYGFFFDLDIPLFNKEVTFSNIMMFELIFSAPHGSLIRFKKEKDKIIPVLANVEQNNTNYDVVRKFQSAALSIIESYLKKYQYLKNITIEDSVKHFRNFVLARNSEDLIQFKNLTNNLGIGVNKDIRPYVNVLDYDEWVKDKRKIHEASSKSLWTGSVLIKKGNKYISMHDEEVYKYLYWENKLNSVKNNIFVKAILHPKKAWKKLIYILSRINRINF